MTTHTVVSLKHVRRNEMKYLNLVLTNLTNILLFLILAVLLAPAPVMVDVEIYLSDGELIYCATGTLAPPAVHQGSGQIAKGKESYC